MINAKTKSIVFSTINAVTDPGVFLNIGNAVVNAPRSSAAIAVNIATAVLCAAIRMASELKKRGLPLPLPKAIDKFVENTGASLATNGGLTLLSGAVAAAQIDSHDLSTATPAIMLSLFGGGNIAQGLARRFEEASLAQRLSDSGAQIAYSTALVLASSDAPLPVKLCFIFSGVAGIGLAIAKRQSFGPVSPLLMNAAGAFGSAATNPNPVLAAANTLWGIGYVGIDILQRTAGGGVVELAQSAFKRRRAQEDTGSPSAPAL